MGFYQEFNKLAEMCYLPKVKIEDEEEENEKICETIREQELKYGERREYEADR